MPDYSKGCIYMIKKQDDYDNLNVYIGSCCNFVRRKCKHKSTCYNPNQNHYNFKLYQYIRENDGWDYWIMTKIIDYPCNSKSELNTMERRYIDEYKSKLNSNIPTRTMKEYKNQYRNDNKENIAQKKKEWYYDNREIIAEQRKKYYNNNREIIAEKKREYYDNNREKIAEKQKQEERAKQKVKRDKCGCEVRRDSLSRHKKTTLKCINFVGK